MMGKNEDQANFQRIRTPAVGGRRGFNPLSEERRGGEGAVQFTKKRGENSVKGRNLMAPKDRERKNAKPLQNPTKRVPRGKDKEGWENGLEKDPFTLGMLSQQGEAIRGFEQRTKVKRGPELIQRGRTKAWTNLPVSLAGRAR